MNIPELPSVATALQGILARKAKERHDRILEEIAMKNADTNRLEAESWDAERKAHAKQYEAEANRKRLDDFSKGQHISPETKQWFGNAGYGDLIQDTPTGETQPYGNNEDGSIAEGPVQEMDSTYLGSPAEQKEDRQTVALQALINNEQFKKADPLTQSLMARQAGITNWNPAAFQKVDNGTHSPIWVEYQDYVGSLPEGSPHMSFDEYQTKDANRKAVLARAGAGSGGAGSYNNQLIYADDPDNPDKQAAFWADPRHPEAAPKRISLGGVTKANPQRVDPNRSVLDESVATKYATVRNGTDPAQKEQKQNMAPILIDTAHASPAVKEAAHAILTSPAGKNGKNPFSTMSSADIAAQSKGDNGQPLTPEDQHALAEILTALRGR